ncbi:MAG: hypothetical protein Q8M07_12020 [Prosthecobacter sp.]|nr:hypothetical protein [Prosthecobacter sp.]
MKSKLLPMDLARTVICLLIWTAAARLEAAPASYQLNETIEVSTTGAWDKATVIEVGAPGGEHEGQYKVHFIGYAASYDRWLQPIYFRKVAAGAAPAAAPKAGYQLNERIEVSTTGTWDKATVIEVGTAGGAHEGEYKVHFDGYAASYDRWLLPVYFRKVAGGAPTTPAAPTSNAVPAGSIPATPNGASADASSAPRPGKYNIHSYGAVGNPPLFLGHIDLQAGGKYRISRRSSGDYYGEGTFAFDAATSTVTWLSGPCKDDGWSGTFTIEREGKTHKIRLKRTTIATNSVD